MSSDTSELLAKASCDPKSLTLPEALQLESDIAAHHDVCPTCENSFEDVGIFNDGSLLFIHENNGSSLNGCEVDDLHAVHPAAGGD